MCLNLMAPSGKAASYKGRGIIRFRIDPPYLGLIQ